MTDDERNQMLQDFHNIIRSAHLSRGAVMVSTPEQIVHMTAKSIAENLAAYANGEDARYRWFPQTDGMVADILREIRGARNLTDKAKATAESLILRAASGWPA